MTSQVPEPDAFKARVRLNPEAVMSSALDKAQQVRAAADGSGSDLGMAESIGMLAESLLSVLTFLGYGPVSEPKVGPAPGPDGVVCDYGCDAWSISSDCARHRTG